MPQVLPDDEIAKDRNSLNSKQREVFNVVHTWAKNFVKYDGHEPVQIILSGSGRTGKSHLVKVIYNAIRKHCFIIVRTLRNQEFFYLDLQEYQQ